MDLEDFVVSHLPDPPSRVLELGCGTGELASALAARDYAITAIDPEAPDGPMFIRTSLEDFTEPGLFHAVVASRSLHHISNLVEGLNKIRALLPPGGLLILNEFAWDQMDERTARWYLSHVPDPGSEDESLRPANFLHAWIAEHEGLHDASTMRRALDELFQMQLFEWVPYIAEHYLEREDLVPEEQRLVQSGDINALGFRYVCARR